MSVRLSALDERRRRWSSQARLLAVMDDDELGRLVDRTHIDGWGASSTATLPDGSLVFVKRLPLTEVEYERAHSTRNHFTLPTYYQYGVGSAGFGAWRELATHVKTTGWVVDGSCTAFPLLVHHRVMRRRRAAQSAPTRGSRSWVDSPEYVMYWNASKRIGSFIAARRETPFELWLVLEHVPHRMFDWIRDHQGAVAKVVDAQIGTLRFLHENGVFHFDAHFGNVVTDGSAPLLTDFGLASDRAFALSSAERAFVDRHAHYDFGETIYSVGNALLGFRDLPDLPADHDAAIAELVANVRALDVSRAYADVIARYRAVILFMASFFSAMRHNRRKNTFFDDARLTALLKDAGVDVG
ncbi:MAG: hypothetical protein QOK28_3584 [Actinomycetota bacterium]